MAKNRPVRIWMTRQAPSSEPKFHQAEMFEGAGRSINEWLTILISGWVLRRLVIRFL